MKLGLVTCLALACIECGGDAFTAGGGVDGAHVLVDAGDEVLDEGHELGPADVGVDGQGAEQVLDGQDGHADGGSERDASAHERDATPDREELADAFVDAAPLMICVSFAIPCPSTYPLQCCHSSPCVCCTQATTTCP